MRGIYLTVSDDDKYLDLTIHPGEVESANLTEKELSTYIKTQYSQLFVFEDTVREAVRNFSSAKRNNIHDPIVERVAERQDAQVKFTFASDDMSASVEVTCAYGGKHATPTYLINKAKDTGIIRGLSTKRLIEVATEARTAPPGTVIKKDIAKGLPARNGRNSKMVPLVPNALERILRPQTVSTSRVDMRDLGEIICVKPDVELLERQPPGNGRAGYTVRGGTLDAKEGEWLPLKPGDGTYISSSNQNVLLSAIAGMPKYKDGTMWVDQTFVSKGVNVGTGNVNYDGSVIVNGDVTEKMRVVASGDVTINGFVESAHIEAGGDIIITQGAMGKYDEEEQQKYSGTLVAQGSVHIEHGQGLDILCNGNVTVGKQLAYSRIKCQGSITVGPLENPNGNLFACDIQCQDIIRSGTLGAVSGSHLTIDFSAGFNMLTEKIENIDNLLSMLRGHVSRHQDKMTSIRKRKIPPELLKDMETLLGKYRDERSLMQQLVTTAKKLKLAKERYVEQIQLNASKKLFPGVVVKLNNRTWKADREYSAARIHYEDHQWQYDAL